jgi:hypothetical protein
MPYILYLNTTETGSSQNNKHKFFGSSQNNKHKFFGSSKNNKQQQLVLPNWFHLLFLRLHNLNPFFNG